ncbi:hypothetical protein N9N28_08955 [Rubripirellula amarantea]|nr:hypothetical protein [Rubripirellula amarantea]
MPSDVRYETVDIQSVNAKDYNVRTTATLIVFVDGNLEDTSSGLLRGDRLRAFLDRWGFTDNETRPDDVDRTEDNFNPWSNPRRWNRGPIRDRIDNAKDRFAWWLIGKWLGFTGGGAAIVAPWLILIFRALRKLRSTDSLEKPRQNRRRKSTRKTTKNSRNHRVSFLLS